MQAPLVEAANVLERTGCGVCVCVSAVVRQHTFVSSVGYRRMVGVVGGEERIVSGVECSVLADLKLVFGASVSVTCGAWQTTRSELLYFGDMFEYIYKLKIKHG